MVSVRGFHFIFLMANDAAHLFMGLSAIFKVIIIVRMMMTVQEFFVCFFPIPCLFLCVLAEKSLPTLRLHRPSPVFF